MKFNLNDESIIEDLVLNGTKRDRKDSTVPSLLDLCVAELHHYVDDMCQMKLRNFWPPDLIEKLFGRCDVKQLRTLQASNQADDDDDFAQMTDYLWKRHCLLKYPHILEEDKIETVDQLPSSRYKVSTWRALYELKQHQDHEKFARTQRKLQKNSFEGPKKCVIALNSSDSAAASRKRFNKNKDNYNSNGNINNATYANSSSAGDRDSSNSAFAPPKKKNLFTQAKTSLLTRFGSSNSSLLLQFHIHFRWCSVVGVLLMMAISPVFSYRRYVATQSQSPKSSSTTTTITTIIPNPNVVKSDKPKPTTTTTTNSVHSAGSRSSPPKQNRSSSSSSSQIRQITRMIPSTTATATAAANSTQSAPTTKPPEKQPKLVRTFNIQKAMSNMESSTHLLRTGVSLKQYENPVHLAQKKRPRSPDSEDDISTRAEQQPALKQPRHSPPPPPLSSETISTTSSTTMEAKSISPTRVSPHVTKLFALKIPKRKANLQQ